VLLQVVKCARSGYAAQYVPPGSDLDKENAGHLHFIDVLKQIRDLLKSVNKANVVVEDDLDTDAKKKAAAENLNNIFSCLEVEEPVEDPLAQRLSDFLPVNKQSETSASDIGKGDPGSRHKNQRGKKEVSKAKVDLRKTKFELKEGKTGSIAVELLCFLQDLNDVRQHVRGIWLQYGKVELTLLEADNITNTAFGLMGEATKDFVAVSPEFRGYWETFSFLLLGTALSRNTILVGSALPGPSPTNPRSESTLLRCSVRRQLSSFAHSLRKWTRVWDCL
jgi:hypothetical protein